MSDNSNNSFFVVFDNEAFNLENFKKDNTCSCNDDAKNYYYSHENTDDKKESIGYQSSCKFWIDEDEKSNKDDECYEDHFRKCKSSYEASKYHR